MQKPLFMLGWGLLAAAFGAAAMETMAPVLGAQNWPVISAKDLWYTVYPAHYVIFKGWVQNVSPFLWDPVMEIALWPPAWALLAAPGACLVWRFRPNKILRPDQEQELQRQRESLFLFDELARAAADEKLAEDGGAGEDDRAPRHFVVEDMYEAGELETWDKAEGAPPDEHDVLSGLDGPDAPVLEPVFQAPPEHDVFAGADAPGILDPAPGRGEYPPPADADAEKAENSEPGKSANSENKRNGET